MNYSLFGEAFDQLKEQIKAEVLAEIGGRAENDDRYFNHDEAAEYLACKPDRLYALKSQGAVPYHKDGSRNLYKKSELDEYVRNGGAKRR